MIAQIKRPRWRTAAMAVITLLAATCTARADDKVFSGPQKGEKLPGFKAVGVHDDLEGKERDFVKEADGKPTLLVFVHEITRPTAALLRAWRGQGKPRVPVGPAALYRRPASPLQRSKP